MWCLRIQSTVFITGQSLTVASGLNNCEFAVHRGGMLLFYSGCSSKRGGMTLECGKLKCSISAVLGNSQIKHFKDSIL